MVSLYEKALCRKIADVFEIAGKNGYPVMLFTRLWFSSRCCFGLCHDDFFAVAQSPLYQFNSLLLECPELGGHKNTESGYTELLYWAGYIITYWMFLDKITWEELSKTYDYELMMRNYGYLHTLSPESAIAQAREEYSRYNMARQSIFSKR